MLHSRCDTCGEEYEGGIILERCLRNELFGPIIKKGFAYEIMSDYYAVLLRNGTPEDNLRGEESGHTRNYLFKVVGKNEGSLDSRDFIINADFLFQELKTGSISEEEVKRLEEKLFEDEISGKILRRYRVNRIHNKVSKSKPISEGYVEL